MSDKNPYYSIPKALGEPSEEITWLPISPELMRLAELNEQIRRDIYEALTGRPFVRLP